MKVPARGETNVDDGYAQIQQIQRIFRAQDIKNDSRWTKANVTDYALYRISLLKGKRPSPINKQIIDFFDQSEVFTPIEGLSRSQQLDFLMAQNAGRKSLTKNNRSEKRKGIVPQGLPGVMSNYYDTFSNLLLLEAHQPGAFRTLYDYCLLRRLHRYDVLEVLLPQYLELTSPNKCSAASEKNIPIFYGISDRNNSFGRNSEGMSVTPKSIEDLGYRIIRYEVGNPKEFRQAYSNFLQIHPGSPFAVIASHGGLGTDMCIGTYVDDWLDANKIREVFRGLKLNRPVDVILDTCQGGANAKPFVRFSHWWMPPLPNLFYWFQRIGPSLSKDPNVGRVYGPTTNISTLRVYMGGDGRPLPCYTDDKHTEMAVFENGKLKIIYSVGNLPL